MTERSVEERAIAQVRAAWGEDAEELDDEYIQRSLAYACACLQIAWNDAITALEQTCRNFAERFRR